MSSRHLLLGLAQRYPGLIFLSVALGFSGALFNGISTALIIPVLLSCWCSRIQQKVHRQSFKSCCHRLRELLVVKISC